MNKDISVLGIKMDLGLTNRGADKGPEAIRQLGLLSELESYFINTYDYGDITSEASNLLNQDNPCDIDINNSGIRV